MQVVDAERSHFRAVELQALLDHLKRIDYRFVTPTPATHGRVVTRPDRQQAHSVADVLGWSLPFRRGAIDADIERLLVQAGVLTSVGTEYRSTIRVSSLHGLLFVHSAYPTLAENAVFFGPDSYRFADLIEQEMTLHPCDPDCRIVDIGTGSGVGVLTAGRLAPRANLFATDINTQALAIAQINARWAGIDVCFVEGNNLSDLDGSFDLILINPPYIMDSAQRAYRDGGAMHGAEVALDMTRAALQRLSQGGRLLLYTGSAIVNGNDALQAALRDAAYQHRCLLSYRELDPDVFGEELEDDAYADVDRIAVVAATFTRQPV